MPFVTGIELIEKLRKNEATMHIPTILLTARSFAITQEMQETLGVQECLSKPFSPKELLKTIEDILYQRAVAVKS
jgi:CheY-like chemotaxis protein